MSEGKPSLAETLKQAMAKKHAANHPDAKDSAGNPKETTKPKGPAAGSKPIRKAAGRGR